MDKRIYICAAVILIFGLLGLVVYNEIEIYPDKAYSRPAREVRENIYFAMERWLEETGHSVRVERYIYPDIIAAAAENVVMVESTACYWSNAEEVIPWIESGGCLIISLDYAVYKETYMIDEYLLDFISSWGIGIEILKERSAEETFPNFSQDIYFTVDEDADVYTINDRLGFARLAEVPIGNGTLTVIGRPVFMYNYNLHKDVNAQLAWNLTGAMANGNNTGILFVRDIYTPQAFFGAIMERGNLLPVGVSAFLVIFVGFWAVIPLFGMVLTEKQKTSRPIRERFTAEIRFLKKYEALDYYLDVYEREQKPEGNPGNKKTYKYRELINQYRRIFDGTTN
jgi:hypothetical protein